MEQTAEKMTNEQIRDRVAALRCLIVGKSFTARDQDWLCDQLTRALDRNEAMEREVAEGGKSRTARLDESDTDAGTARPASHVPFAAPEAR